MNVVGKGLKLKLYNAHLYVHMHKLYSNISRLEGLTLSDQETDVIESPSSIKSQSLDTYSVHSVHVHARDRKE